MRINEKWRKRINGSVSIFLVLILVPMMTFAGIIVDFSRMSASNVVLSGAGDLAMNAAMSDFDEQMKDIYGIFAMSAESKDPNKALNDNLRRYFNNSLTNTAEIEASDSYTREYINTLCSWFTNTGTYGDADFETLIELGNATMEASYVKGSEVYQPNIMRREILEYMKYRGPVSISTSLLSKFASFSGFKQQNDAIDKKVEYDKKLDEMNDKCKEAYKALVACRDYQYAIIANEKADRTDIKTFENSFNSTFKNIKKVYDDEISEYLVAYKMYSAKSLSDIKIDIDKETQEMISSILTEDDLLKLCHDSSYGGAGDQKKKVDANTLFIQELCFVLSKLDEAKLSAGLSIDYETNANSSEMNTTFTFNDSLGNFGLPAIDGWKTEVSVDNTVSNANLIDQMNNWRSTISNEDVIARARAVVYFAEHFDEYNQPLFNSATFKNDYEKYSTNITSTKAYVDIISTNNSYGQRVTSTFNPNGKLDTFAKNVEKYKKDLRNATNEMIVGTIDATRAMWLDCMSQELNYADAISKVNALKTEIEKLNKARQNWKDSIDKISDTNVKQNMQSNYDSTADLLKESDVTKLVDEVLKPKKAFFKDLKGKVETITYAEHTLFNYDVEDQKYVEDLIDKISAPPTNEVKNTQPVKDAKKLYSMTDEYSKHKSFGDKLISNDVKPSQVPANQKLFEYLIKTCGREEPEAEKNSKDNLKKAKKNLLDKSKESKKKGNGRKLSKSVNSDGFSVVLNGGDDKVSSTDGEVDDDDKDSKVASNAQKKMKSQDDFLGKIGGIAKAGGQDLYINEYINKMFSCYTTNLDEKGNTLEGKDVEKTLSNELLNAENNVYYAGEVEYILWGGDPKSAVDKTKATIFGIRFVLNTIYAFTSPEIQSMALQWATAIAGWTGFGIPIVQTVITIALSLGESLLDLEMLCQGKSVAIYKSSSTWRLSPQGLVQAAKEEAAAAIDKAAKNLKEIAGNGLDDLYGKIEKTSVDAIGTLSNDVNKYIEDSVNNVKDTVMSATVEPFRSTIQGLLYQIDTSWSENTIKQHLDDAIDQMIANVGDEDSTFSQAELYALNELKKHTQDIASTIHEKSSVEVAANQYVSHMNEIADAVESKINGIADSISKGVTSKINDLTAKAQQKIRDSLKESKDKVKDKVNKSIDEFSSKVTSNLNSKLDEVGKNAPASPSNCENAKAATLTLNYKEYLYAFSYVGIIANGDNMMRRTAFLIQCNMAKRNKDFDIKNKYTMISVTAEAEVGASFLGVFELESDSSGQSVSAADDFFENAWRNGKTTNKIKYNGLVGY